METPAPKADPVPVAAPVETPAAAKPAEPVKKPAAPLAPVKAPTSMPPLIAPPKKHFTLEEAASHLPVIADNPLDKRSAALPSFTPAAPTQDAPEESKAEAAPIEDRAERARRLKERRDKILKAKQAELKKEWDEFKPETKGTEDRKDII